MQKARLGCPNVAFLVRMFSQKMKETRTVKISSALHYVCLLWRSASVSLLPYSCCA